jgi:hypothetical protein
MSLINSECCLPLFLDNVTNNLFLSTNLSDSLNDISTETKKEDIPFKQIKFVLTKEEVPLISLLQKKTLPKIDLKNYDSNTNSNNRLRPFSVWSNENGYNGKGKNQERRWTSDSCTLLASIQHINSRSIRNNGIH